MKIIWLIQAAIDRDNIISYVEGRNPVAARSIAVSFKEKPLSLLKYPKLYRAGRVRGTREMSVPPHYLVVYRIGQETIEILRILHGAQDWPQG